jgi:hypothetical protein
MGIGGGVKKYVENEHLGASTMEYRRTKEHHLASAKEMLFPIAQKT